MGSGIVASHVPRVEWVWSPWFWTDPHFSSDRIRSNVEGFAFQHHAVARRALSGRRSNPIRSTGSARASILTRPKTVRRTSRLLREGPEHSRRSGRDRGHEDAICTSDRTPSNHYKSHSH